MSKSLLVLLLALTANAMAEPLQDRSDRMNQQFQAQ